MSSSKKAQIEISFNWIFVLIAGAAILFFFINVIGGTLDEEERGSHRRAVSRMNILITALQQNPDSVRVEDHIGYEIYFECTAEGQAYGIKNSDARETLPHQIVFTPSAIGNSNIVTWVRTFKTPFPLSSVLYLTDKKTKYIFLEDFDTNNRIKHYYDLFPNNITKEMMTKQEFEQIRDEDYREYIIIMSQQLTSDSFTFQDERNLRGKIRNFIVIDETNNQIQFHELPQGMNVLDTNYIEKSYITEEAVIGAIISGTPELYKCTMNKVLEQIRIITDIHLKRL